MRNKNKSPSEVDNLSSIKKNEIDNSNKREENGVSATTTTKDPELSDAKTDESDNKNNSEKFFTFTFYKVDPKWRWLNEMGKDESSREFLELLNAARKRMKIITYSTIGLRHESEFMIWTISPSLENIQVLASKIYTTILGKYIEPTSTYLSLTRKSFYSNQVKLGFETEEEPLQYVVVYPFIKSREWYLLPFEKRKEMMEEHIRVGRKYPEIRLNTTYSFGIDDQDFMLAFETDNLSRFQNLIIDLRETQVSKYIIKDTPMIPCVLKNIEEIIKSLG
ncbi:MAG: chlorite dismutase family protein [Thermoproteota archaeon]|nr:chlorite dismutase family protein [Thermoproteota archaeon]